MEFRIADSFTSSLARLTGEEQKAVKTTAFDLQMNPAQPGLQFHRLDKAKDKNFWSVRVNGDIRVIVHRSDASLLLCYVDHHDKAYHWAERRKLEIHPRTGAAQFVEIRERVEEIVLPLYVEAVAPAKPVKPTRPLLAHLTEADLLEFGVPGEWVPDVLQADEDGLLRIADHLPAEAAEAVLEFATGSRPKPLARPVPVADPFLHPDAQRRFRTLANADDLRQALEYPWEKWILFLHPSQREFVDKEFSGPARVSGSAGTGKTIVALHRAVALARRHPDARVLLTTFSEPLANALRSRVTRLLASEPRLGERLDVHALDALGQRLYALNIDKSQLADGAWLTQAVRSASTAVGGHKFSQHFLVSEWNEVVDAWQLGSWEAYRDVKRLGRRSRLSESQRAVLWSIFEKVQAALEKANLVTRARQFTRLAEHLQAGAKPPYDYAVVDEAQDIQIPQLRFLAALGKGRPGTLFFAGDLGQRIFQAPFSWKSLGVDVRGRAATLKVNYRTSHQIRSYADRLLAPEMADGDGLIESRSGTVSAFNGKEPEILRLDDPAGEIATVAEWIRARMAEGYRGHEIGVFVRSGDELERAMSAVAASGASFRVLNAELDVLHGHVSIGTMHLAKGLEFRAVVVMACEDEILPLQSRIESISDEADLEEAYNTERHLLYVACTRARDRLLVTCGGEASEFLDDLGKAPLPKR
jgi:mRNA-degrading endonuclease RelE of RelBE toxin-antitoxin system